MNEELKELDAVGRVDIAIRRFHTNLIHHQKVIFMDRDFYKKFLKESGRDTDLSKIIMYKGFKIKVINNLMSPVGKSDFFFNGDKYC